MIARDDLLTICNRANASSAATGRLPSTDAIKLATRTGDADNTGEVVIEAHLGDLPGLQ